MNYPIPLTAQVAASDDQYRPVQTFIPLFMMAALLAFGTIIFLFSKLATRLRKSRDLDKTRFESLKRHDLESTVGHSSVTCCGTVEDLKKLNLYTPSAIFETEVEEIAKHHSRLISYDAYDIAPARRSSSIFITRFDSVPSPARVLLCPGSPRRASIPVVWNNSRSRWGDETRLGSRHSPHGRPATSPMQRPKEPPAAKTLRRSVTPGF
ncbi:unnamed protein product [Rhizoctonia solani]|uniref:Uncharacterized protein n=1 Tax=Rhizoctonia solani TaxID=456999 RepID=A0A8H3B5V3_9AGAM|nr:unnamed protein product [Rhizoctonia solani]